MWPYDIFPLRINVASFDHKPIGRNKNGQAEKDPKDQTQKFDIDPNNPFKQFFFIFS